MIWDGRVRGFGRGEEDLETSPKVNLGRKWLEMADEGKSSCEKLWAVLDVLLVVNTLLETNIQAEMPKS